MEETELSDGWMDGWMDPPPDGVQLHFKDSSEAPSQVIAIIGIFDLIFTYVMAK